MPTPYVAFSVSIDGPLPRSQASQLLYHGHGGAGRIVLTGAMSYDVDLAMIPAAGLKGLLVVVDPLDASDVVVTDPVIVTWTADGVESSIALRPVETAAAWVAIACPSPVDGIVGLTLTSTSDAVAHVVALG